MAKTYRWMYPAGDQAYNGDTQLPYAGASVSLVQSFSDGLCVVRYGGRNFIATRNRLEYTGY